MLQFQEYLDWARRGKGEGPRDRERLMLIHDAHLGKGKGAISFTSESKR